MPNAPVPVIEIPELKLVKALPVRVLAGPGMIVPDPVSVPLIEKVTVLVAGNIDIEPLLTTLVNPLFPLKV